MVFLFLLGMNLVSWMFDVFGGSDLSGGVLRKKGSMKRSVSGIVFDGLLFD